MRGSSAASTASSCCKAADAGKDQTYFLHQLSQAQLDGTMFPVGDLAKRDVRAIAREQGIPTYAKKDSTGICFIGERPFREFLARYLPTEPGPIETASGETVGRHQGLAYYTLGQRQGLGVGGTRGGGPAPWFVAGKDLARNALIVVQGHDDPRLYADVVETGTMHWITAARRAAGVSLPRRATGWRTHHARSSRSPQDAGAYTSTRRNGRRRRGNIWCSTMARRAWAGR